MRSFLDYLTCEIMFISDVNSPLDDSVILCAFELKFLSVFACFFSGSILESTYFMEFCFLMFFFAVMMI